MYQIVILTLMIIKPLVCILPEVQPKIAPSLADAPLSYLDLVKYVWRN